MPTDDAPFSHDAVMAAKNVIDRELLTLDQISLTPKLVREALEAAHAVDTETLDLGKMSLRQFLQEEENTLPNAKPENSPEFLRAYIGFIASATLYSAMLFAGGVALHSKTAWVSAMVSAAFTAISYQGIGSSYLAAKPGTKLGLAFVGLGFAIASWIPAIYGGFALLLGAR